MHYSQMRCDRYLAGVIWALRDPCSAVGFAVEPTWVGAVLSSPAGALQSAPTGALPGSPAAEAHSPVGGCAEMTHSLAEPFAQTPWGTPLQKHVKLHGWTAGAATADSDVQH